MGCFSKRTKRNITKYSKNIVVPYDDSVPVIAYHREIKNEVITCFHCKERFSLSQNKIDVHCSGCLQFFHCHIAGECLGKHCPQIDGLRFRYCKDCCGKQLNKHQCLCKTCY